MPHIIQRFSMLVIVGIAMSGCSQHHENNKIVSPLNIYPDRVLISSAKKTPQASQESGWHVTVASKSKLKIQAAGEILKKCGVKISSIYGEATPSGIAPQPIGLSAGQMGAENRIKGLVLKPPYIKIAIENFFTEDSISTPVDFAFVIVEICARPGEEVFTYKFISDGVVSDRKIFDAAKLYGKHPTNTGFNGTLGDVMSKQYGWESDNWMINATDGKMSRHDQILTALNYEVR